MKTQKSINSARKGILLAQETLEIIRDPENRIKIQDQKCLRDSLLHDPDTQKVASQIADGSLFEAQRNSERMDESRRDSAVKRLAFALNNRQQLRRKRATAVRWIGATAAAVVVVGLILYVMMPNLNLESNSTVAQTTKIEFPTLIRPDGESQTLSNEVLDTRDQPTPIANASSNRPNVVYNEVVVPSKYTCRLILPDGSQVVLNANSRLRYPQSFTDSSRTVFVEGEAYFKVTKSQVPFEVSTSKGNVRVYGTEFNVKLNRDNLFQIVLITGRVGVRPSNQIQSEIIMKPDQVLEINRGGAYTLKDVDTQEYTGWINGNFRYTHLPFASLLEEIANWYGVRFEFRSEEVREIPISLNLSRSMELSKLLRTLEFMVDVRFIEQKGGVYIVK